MRMKPRCLMSRCLAAGIAILLSLFSVLHSALASETVDETLWQAFKAGEAFAIMRHAIAPGTGDPANFKLGECSTQRNLSVEGREQARRAGELFRANGVKEALVYSSQWCRCRETARLLATGPVRDLESLNSFYEAYERRSGQTRELKAWLQARPTGKPLILVTHQVNITALVGDSVRSGEIFFVKPGSDGEYTVLGTIVP